MAEKVPSGNEANSGALLRHPKGSNGGVNRGPDLQPRGLGRAIILKGLTDEGSVAAELAGLKGKKRVKVRHAMVLNAARGLQNIMADAAAGKAKAYRPLLECVKLIHEIMQPGKDEQRGGGQPFPSRFVRPSGEPTSRAPAPTSGEDAVVVGGQAYVDGDA
jgi:hypothetical protein